MIDQITLPKEAISAFCKKHHIRKLSLFGSILRDDFTPESDIDVLVEFDPDQPVGFFEFCAMQDELSEIMERKIDLHTPGSLSCHFQKKVLALAKVIYE